jgi:hypothetical protein
MLYDESKHNILAYYQGKANKASAICPVVLDSSL